MSITEQCVLLSISHSGFYYISATESERNLSIMNAIDKIHTAYPFYGFRRIRKELENYGFFAGKKLIIRLMNLMAIHTLYPKPKTAVPNIEHAVYPYLLRDLTIDRINRVWQMDITYISVKHGFMYLAAIIDVCSRMILGRQISNTMEAPWCRETVENAVAKCGCPQIFNTDRGSQFTSREFTGYLPDNKIQVSMDGRGRVTDNICIERFWRSVKQEKIYLNAYETGSELYAGLCDYMKFYNEKRPHQSLDYKCPANYYKKSCAINWNIEKNVVTLQSEK